MRAFEEEEEEGSKLFSPSTITMLFGDDERTKKEY